MQFKSVALLALAGSALAVETTSLNSTLTSTTAISVPSGCSFSKTYTATDQAALDKLSSCSAIEGDIYVTGDLGTASIANVKAIYGSLTVSNCSSLTSFAADSLTTITKQLELEKLFILDTLSFGSLVSVGSINWVTLPALSQTGLSASVSDCQSIYISDTQLESLDGLNPASVELFDVNNNLNLGSIKSDIESVSNALAVSYNGEDTEVVFDKLSWANNITFYSVSSISMSNLTVVNSSVGFFESNVEELDFSTLTKVGGDLTVENNDELTEIDFSGVKSIGGGFVIVNNSKLGSIDNFDLLKSVGGAVILKGDFENATLPMLSSVRGGFDLETTGELDCDKFKALDKKGAIQGDKFVCSAKTESTSSTHSKTASSSSKGSATSGSAKATSTGSSDEESTSSSSSSSSSKAGASVNTVSFFGTVAALVLALL